MAFTPGSMCLSRDLVAGQNGSDEVLYVLRIGASGCYHYQCVCFGQYSLVVFTNLFILSHYNLYF